MEKVILVDVNDNPVGTLEKLEAHKKGVLHRAFSILVFNSKGEMLIQKRASSKYHSGGLWTNACCSHPLPEETMAQATRKRLQFEMGVDLQPEFSHKFIYKTSLNNGLTEHELDYVYIGTFDGVPNVNADEVEDWKFVGLSELKADMKIHPEHYTYWFREIMNHTEIDQLV